MDKILKYNGTIQIKAVEQYFPVVLLQGGSNVCVCE